MTLGPHFLTPAFGLGPALFALASSVASAGVSTTFTYQGRLTNSSGAAIADNAVVVRVRILDTSGTCVLYSEMQTINTSGSSGIFSMEIGSETGAGVGSAKRTAGEDPGNTMSQVFDNSGTAIVGRQLSSLGTACSPAYTPAAADDRKLQFTVVSTSSQGALNLVLSPLQRIGSVPYATVAQTLNGYSATQFLRLNGSVVSPSANVTGGNVNSVMDLLFASSSAGYNKLSEILNNYTTGTGFTFSSLNMSMGGNRITGLGAPSAGTDAVNKNYCDANVGGQATSGLGTLAAGDTGKALVWNGSAWVAQAINSLPTQMGNGGRFLTTDGTAASWSTISQVPVQTGHSGKFLTTDGTSAS